MSINVMTLRKKYGLQTAVNDISFSVGMGEIVGFLGPNGAGKSTTMKIITGYLAADGGSVTVCGEKVSPGKIHTKKQIGYLPEANPLYSEMYVREYLRFLSNVHGLVTAAKRIEEVITIVGLAAEANKKVGQLSKGFKQRVGLAGALLHDPAVLILDEPTTGLDPNQILEIRELIRQLGKNKTVLFSSHIMQEVEAICDRVIIIHKGNIVADNHLSDLRREMGGNPKVLIEFNEPVAPEKFSSLTGIIAMQQTAAYQFELECKNPDSLKKELLQWSIQHHLNIRSLQTGSHSLEAVFKSLTN